MGCCGDRRTTWATRAEPLPRAGFAAAGRGAVRVAYVGGNTLTVRGSYTGRSYRFSPQSRIHLVDAADSRVLLRTRFFRRA